MTKKEMMYIEHWEHYYLEQMYFMLLRDENKMISIINSKDEIKADWIKVYRKKSCDIDRGAERVFQWLLHFLGIPNSTPIGSDIMYETSNAFIHLDVKTTSYMTKTDGVPTINTGDFHGLVPLIANQTSYKSISKKGIHRDANLPKFYSSKRKLCLTYIIHLIHDKEPDGNIKILALVLISVPNGALKPLYGEKICGVGKTPGNAFRYLYYQEPTYSTLENNLYRFKNLYLHPDFSSEPEKINRIRIND